MAFELLVELGKEEVNWKRLNSDLKERAKGLIEFFPIPDYEGSGKKCLGISVAPSDMSQDKIHAFKETINFLLDNGHSIYELYSSQEFTKENVDDLSIKFLVS